MIGQTIGQLRVCMAHKGGGSGTGPTFPVTPNLTAPANAATVFNGFAVTVSATSTDLDLDRIDWILDPAGAATVIASDLVSPYSQSWTPTGVSLGAHVLIARAVRGGFSTDSASISINVVSAIPATPTLTAPAANALVFNGTAVTVSATTVDTNLTKMEWVLDPSGANTVVATVVGVGTPAGTFSTTWTPTGVAAGPHTLVARATRGGTTNSASISIQIDLVSGLFTQANVLRSWQNAFALVPGGTPLASGTTPPVVTLSGAVPAGSTPAVRIEVQTTGADGVATYRYGNENTGSTSTWIEQNKVVPAGGGTYAAIGALAGLILNFPAGTYTNTNVYQATAASWVDQKNGQSYAQAVAAKQPKILLKSGLCVLSTDGVDDSMADTTLDLPVPTTTPTFIYFAFRQLFWATGRRLLSSASGTEGAVITSVTSSPTLGQYNSGNANANSGATIGTMVRGYASFTGTTADALKLGSAAETTGVSALVANPGPGVRIFASVTDVSPMGADLCLMIYLNARPSPAELAAADTLCATLFGATI